MIKQLLLSIFALPVCVLAALPADSVRWEEYNIPVETLASSASEITFKPLEYLHIRTRDTTPLPDAGLCLNLENMRGEFTYPVRGKLISDYGMRNGRPHTGIDLKASRGDTVVAALPGVVRISKPYSSYGNIVVIRHYNGLETLYSHNSGNLVKPDDVVFGGQPIALAGRTGRASTEHLHFEVRAAGEPIDPKLLIDPAEMDIRSGWLYVNMKKGKVYASNTEPGIEQEIENSELLAASNTITQSTPVTPATPLYHTVKTGEVLGKIARKYGTSISKICSLNSLESPDKIREGQKLRVK